MTILEALARDSNEVDEKSQVDAPEEDELICDRKLIEDSATMFQSIASRSKDLVCSEFTFLYLM